MKRVPAVRVALGMAGLIAVLASIASPVWSQESGWFVSFERESVSQIPRTDTALFQEIGTIETDGFTEMRISIGGEFKDVVPKTGTVGVVLIPDIKPFPYLLENEGHIVFSVEANVTVGAQTGALFFSEPVVAKVAFPAYRVYLYNDTTSVATVSVYVYRARL